MPNYFKPMLACKSTDEQLKELTYPLIATPKIDGFRCTIVNGKPQTRSGKPIENKAIRQLLEDTFTEDDYVDGELIIDNNFSLTSSILRSHNKPVPAELRYIVFDYDMDTTQVYEQRINNLMNELPTNTFIETIPFKVVSNYEQLLEYEQAMLDNGYEGLVLRSFRHRYKNGRSTIREQGMVKVKRFIDEEAIIITVLPARINIADRSTDELGYSRTSHCQDDFIDSDMVGAFECYSDRYTETFKISARSVPEAELRKLWTKRDKLINQPVTFKHFSYGAKDRPRHGIFKALRPHWDI